MDPAEQAKKFKLTGNMVLLGSLIIGGIAVLGLTTVAVLYGAAIGRPEPGALPCREDWNPVQLNAEIEEDPYQYVGQCFELEGTVDFSERPEGATSNSLYVRSDTGGHTYIIAMEDMPPCVMGSMAEGSRVSASAYLRWFPASRYDGTVLVFFDCAIPDEVGPRTWDPLRATGG